MVLLDQYMGLQKQIYEYFGYVEDWRVIPINDSREYFWNLDESTGRVLFWEKPEDLDSGEHYENFIYQQRFLTKWVYRAEEYTMIVVDTHTDGNKFLQIFANALEVQGVEVD